MGRAILGALMILLLGAALATAQVPELAPVPSGLPADRYYGLLDQRRGLEAGWDALVAEVARHNQRCARVPAGSALDRSCSEAMARLRARLAAFQEKAQHFNRQVASEKMPVTPAHPLLSEANEVAMGREVARRVESEVALISDPQVAAYMQSLGRRMAALSTRPGMPYTFKVIDRGSVNAFALPGGFIYLHKGLVSFAANQSELAGVLAHEVGHVAGRHHANETFKMVKAMGAGIVAGGLTGPVTGMGLLSQRYFQQMAYLKFTRDEEREADRMAVEMLYRAGIKPTGLITLFERMRRAKGGEKDYFARFKSTHPSLEERQKNLAPLLADPRFNRSGEIDSARFRVIRARLAGP
ncbi:MAG: M48 family metalloprotease [Proteobacteria bacterium]|nr:M48 family metalloprotease [Pseudomonadota bacterium]MBU1451388.1 M48 family metalloprotease [Pseudomonadota bacterium]MBU2467585.1 M48 family metalloprotease [Pseudomonadota bacterium]MBU2519508.1 M48 family metalloprotease [Pseudomonadota bacterium]